MKFYIQFIVIFTCIFISCNSDDKIEGLYGYEILAIKLNIEDDVEIKKVILKSSQGKDSILGHQIKNKSKIKLKTKLISEGTFTLCIITPTDSICSQESYVEGGYRPQLSFKDKKFYFLRQF